MIFRKPLKNRQFGFMTFLRIMRFSDENNVILHGFLEKVIKLKDIALVIHDIIH